MNLVRWFREEWNPQLKCSRVGHAPGIQTRDGMRKPKRGEGERGIAIEFQEKRTVCCRCDTELGAPKEMRANEVDSWTAPKSIWDEFERKGLWLRRQWS